MSTCDTFLRCIRQLQGARVFSPAKKMYLNIRHLEITVTRLGPSHARITADDETGETMFRHTFDLVELDRMSAGPQCLSVYLPNLEIHCADAKRGLAIYHTLHDIKCAQPEESLTSRKPVNLTPN